MHRLASDRCRRAMRAPVRRILDDVRAELVLFCADGCRIPGDEVRATAMDARPAPESRPLPPARAMRRRCPAMQWDEIATWLLIAMFVVVVGWQMLHLQLPNR